MQLEYHLFFAKVQLVHFHLQTYLISHLNHWLLLLFAVAVVWCCSRSSIGAIGIILLLRVTMVQSLVGLPLLRA